MNIAFIIANSADPDEMQQTIQYTKDLHVFSIIR